MEMIDLWYVNVDFVSDEGHNNLLKLLPSFIRQDIIRYKFLKDQKLKLFARLLIARYYHEDIKDFDWTEWKTDQKGKPYLTQGRYFNITHSGDYVLVAFSKDEIGVDLEKIKEIDVESFLGFLHIDEKTHLQSNPDKESFYEVWTRKEAFLKAQGIGIVKGLNNENCLNSLVEKERKWFIQSLTFDKEYKLAICTTIENAAVKIQDVIDWH
ncbi:MAG: 4'-phosphopantetheinyl transferase superfamily protein [Bacteroidetes bacterium]|nr:4'-phosphopantetheinyl transferase superfamily protein [Bacteroidota bacterium]